MSVFHFLLVSSVPMVVGTASCESGGSANAGNDPGCLYGCGDAAIPPPRATLNALVPPLCDGGGPAVAGHASSGDGGDDAGDGATGAWCDAGVNLGCAACQYVLSQAGGTGSCIPCNPTAGCQAVCPRTLNYFYGTSRSLDSCTMVDDGSGWLTVSCTYYGPGPLR